MNFPEERESDTRVHAVACDARAGIDWRHDSDSGRKEANERERKRQMKLQAQLSEQSVPEVVHSLSAQSIPSNPFFSLSSSTPAHIESSRERRLAADSAACSGQRHFTRSTHQHEHQQQKQKAHYDSLVTTSECNSSSGSSRNDIASVSLSLPGPSSSLAHPFTT